MSAEKNVVKGLEEIDISSFRMTIGDQLDMMEEMSNIKMENYRLKRKLGKIERKRARRNKFIKSMVSNIVMTLSITMIAWFVISYINVIMNNLSSPENIWSWNFFKVMIEIFG